MENMGDWENMNLPNELTQDRELTKQLQHELHLAVSSSSTSSDDQTQETLIHRILASCDEAMSTLNAEPLVGGCSQQLSELPPSHGGSPMSRRDSNRDLNVGSSPRKREPMQPWTKWVRVAPGSGLEGPLDDGFSWRKYGQKEILGAKYPRGYYRCTHRYVRGCLATKQVQRSDDDPTVFEITYYGKHTCNHHHVAVVPPSPLPENQTDSNASINAAPLQIIQTQTQPQQNQTQSQNIAFDCRGGRIITTPNLDSNNDNHSLSSSIFDFPPTSDNIFGVISNNSNFSSTPHCMSPSKSRTNWFPVSPARLGGFQVGTLESELAMTVSTATSGNNSQATGFHRFQQQQKPFHLEKLNEKRLVEVRVAPGSGLEGPLDDGFSWRKYGQKDILGAKYPRGYYRCTHRNVQCCLATKQVQRSDDDPTVFEITYRGRHTCIHHPVDVVPPSPLPENQTDSNASIDAAPLQIIQPQPQQNQTQSQNIAFDCRGGRTIITPNLDSNNDNHNLSSWMFDCPPTSDNICGIINNNSNFSSTPHCLSPSNSGTNWFSMSPARFDGFQVGTPKSELGLIVSAATSGNNSQETRRLQEAKGVHHWSKSDDNEMQRLVEEKSISDQPIASSVQSSISLGSGLCSLAAEDRKEVKPFFGIGLLHTKAGHLTNEGSLLSDVKEEENVMVSSEAEKVEAMQKQRAESDFVPMQNTRDTETELFPWLVKRDSDFYATLEKVHLYSSHSELEVGSHCSESEYEDTDKKMKIEASQEYHKREASETAVLQLQNTVEPEVEPFSLEVNQDTASEEVHSYSSEQESEVDSYCSELEYEVGDKKARIEASPEYNDILHIPKMQKESSPHATLDNTDASMDRLGNGGKQKGRPSERWGAIKYDSIVDHLIKSIKKSSIEKIGIYGRNEVGKAIVIEALKESAILRNLFDRVVCITAPLNCDLDKVQKEIAGLSFDLTEANAVVMPRLEANALEGPKFLLILVGINQHMKLETLRIPDSTPVGSKIVFVAGSGQLCDEIEVDKKICLDDLLLCELFRQNVGDIVYYPKKVLAREIVRMCRRYSHAVILLARALQNVDDILIWKRALERLTVRPASCEAGIEDLMVNVLRFSIDQLEDDKTRRCLKNLAFRNNYHDIASDSAIGLWVKDGIVDTHDDGQRVLKDLVHANLLQVDENGQFVKFQDQDQDILVNLIFQPEENRVFLLRGGLDLTEPPEVEEWESAKEICLMHTGISELPKEPRCPSLSSLFLQRNYKLRKLSSSFFNQMPALEVLNLSRTRIRCLPESISQLVRPQKTLLE
ncbi:hypothetical protein NL676_039696 [Syzygium grande]|nr:hypothetical protein NL676_039696 [Syzygium grande]